MDLLTALFDFKAMGIEVATGAMFVALFLLLITGMPLAFVTLLVALIFALGWFGPMAVPLITSRIFSFVNSFVFVSVPMFVLMAAILDRSGIARDLFDAMRVVGGRLRGGIAIQTCWSPWCWRRCPASSGAKSFCWGCWRCPRCCGLDMTGDWPSASVVRAAH
jgi:hypothetical protein